MSRYLLIFFILVSQIIYSQELSWDKINSDNSVLPNESVKCFAFDREGAVWIGTYMGGLAYLKDGKWTIYNTSNSELPHNYINSIAIDKNNVKWIGTDGGGISSFDGTNWISYKTSNSGLPSNVVMSVYCDAKGIVWVGTYFGGLARFDGSEWKTFSDENSPLLSNKVVCIAEDSNEILWLGTQGGGVSSFDGKNWNTYTEKNSKLPSDYIYSIAIDQKNNKWIGTGGGGIAVFNDVFWLSFNTGNSDLTDDNIRPIIVDSVDNKWVGTYIGGVNIYDGSNWKVFDYQNSVMPDDEITCMGYNKGKVYIGTERSGIITVTEKFASKPIPQPVVKEVVVPTDTNVNEMIPVDTTQVLTAINLEPKPEPEPKPEIEPEIKIMPVSPPVKTVAKTKNQVVIMFDAADVYFNQKRMDKYERAFRLLLKNRERIDDTYDVTILIYSTNFDVNPKKITLPASELKKLHASKVIYMEGETSFTEAAKKAYGMITDDYNKSGNNHVIAATYKLIRDDETAKVVIKDNVENNYIVFSLLAFETNTWKMEQKMRNMIPKGQGHYYSINHPSIKDNWSVTAQVGLSVFKGDLDVNKIVSFPGVFGFALNKQVLSTGILNGGIKAQFNFGQLNGGKNGFTFQNKYKEGCLNFQVILNNWFNRNFRFEKFRPYVFGGVGFINYRVLLRDADGNIVNGYGYKLIEGSSNANNVDPEKDKAATDLIFPVGLGVNYKIKPKINLEFEASSRFINSDRLDGKVAYNNDKYWFFSVGITYLINNKEFLADILNR